MSNINTGLKRITCTFELDFTTCDESNLPDRLTMRNDIEKLFALTLDGYMSNRDVSTYQTLLIMGGDLLIQEISDE